MKRPAVWVTIAAMGLLAPGAWAQAGEQPGQQKQPTPKATQPAPQAQPGQPGAAAPHSPAHGAQAGAEAAGFEEADWRALILQPSKDIEKGRTDFGKKAYPLASAGFRRAAVELKLAAGHFGGDKQVLMQAAQVLHNLSDTVMPGKNQPANKDVDQDLAFVEYQLAKLHQKEAARLWNSRDGEGAGAFLRMAAHEADNALSYSGQKADKDTKKAFKDADAVGTDLLKGSDVEPDKVQQALDGVGTQIQNLSAASQPSAGKAPAVTLTANLDARDWASLHDLASLQLKAAKSDFGKNGHVDAIGSLRAAGVALKMMATQAGDKFKGQLTEAATELDQKARDLKDGTLKRAGDLDATFAKTELALASMHHDLAQRHWGERKTFESGSELTAAADSLDQALGYRTLQASPNVKKTTDACRKIGGEMMRGSGFAAADVDKAIADLGNELSKVQPMPAKQAQKGKRQAQR